MYKPSKMCSLTLRKILSDAESYMFEYDPNFDFDNRDVKRQSSNNEQKIKESNIKNYYEEQDKKKPEENPFNHTFNKKSEEVVSLIDLLNNNQKITDDLVKPKKNTDYNLSRIHRVTIKPDSMRPRPQFKLKEVCEANEYALSLKDFEEEKTLMGWGSFGEVYLVQWKLNNTKYALKILNKEAVKESGYERHIMREKDILNLLDHPNIVRLESYFHDSDNCYFLFELWEVGDLAEFIQDNKRLSTKLTREFAMELILALEYLKNFNIVHRDLKPQNILLDDAFHIKLADFGAAKQIDPITVQNDLLTRDFSNDDSSDNDSDDESSILSSDDDSWIAQEIFLARENTRIGSPLYTSPEMLRYQIACFASDLWALGWIIFECLVGRPPFIGYNKFEIEDKINNAEYDFPSGFNPEAKDLIEKLLKVSPNDRIGAGTEGFEELKKHPFFKGKSFKRWNKRAPALDSLKKKINLSKYTNKFADIKTQVEQESNDNDDESPESVRSMTFETVTSVRESENPTDFSSSIGSAMNAELIKRKN